ncbi:hypothetical protein J6590_063318 [Homalodisca vitripennis]|nr:hypothetical protein J6590_063318 [Homalodisca vitripennis]
MFTFETLYLVLNGSTKIALFTCNVKTTESNALPKVRRISGVVTTATKLDLVLVVVCDLVRYFRPHAVKAS